MVRKSRKECTLTKQIFCFLFKSGVILSSHQNGKLTAQSKITDWTNYSSFFLFSFPCHLMSPALPLFSFATSPMLHVGLCCGLLKRTNFYPSVLISVHPVLQTQPLLHTVLVSSIHQRVITDLPWTSISDT